MGKIDIIWAVSESIELLREHYKEVIMPIIVLLLFAGASNYGGSSVGNNFSKQMDAGTTNPAQQYYNAVPGTQMIANAMADPNTLLAMLGGALLLIIAVMIVVGIVLSILNHATLLYAYEHFYALLNKKKNREGWKPRFKRLTIKAAVLWAFWTALCIIIFIVPALMIWNGIAPLLAATAAQRAYDSMLASGALSAIMGGLVLLFAGMCVLLLAGFLLAPLWVFYAMDGFGLSDSIKRSFALVTGNLWTFITLAAVFFVLGIASVALAAVTCCFSYLVTPIVSVFLALVYGITLMKIKLALAKK